MSAVYALARRIDDIGDGDGIRPTRSSPALHLVRKDIDPIDPKTNDPVLIAVLDAATRYALPMDCFGEIIDGCEMDLQRHALRDHRRLGEVLPQRRRVRRAAHPRRRGLRRSRTRDATRRLPRRCPAAHQHRARRRRRSRTRSCLYSPRGRRTSELCDRPHRAGQRQVARVVAYECGRADRWFDEGLQLLPLLHGRGRACVGALSGIYRHLLQRIENNPLAVTRGRVSVPTYEKVSVALQSLWAARS